MHFHLVRRLAAYACSALAAGTLAVAAISPAAASDFPTKPIRIIVAFPAGGTTDRDARVLATGLSEVVGQPVVVENIVGGGGVIGTRAAVRAPADGYTLLYSGVSAITINPHLYDNLDFDPLGDLEPIILGTSGSLALYATPGFAPTTADELIAHAKANPGTVNYGISGIGSLPQIVTEIFKGETGVELTMVPYRGSADAIPALISGETDIMFNPVGDGLQHVRSGALRALFVMTPERLSDLPDVPTSGEAGLPQLTFGYYSGMLAPKGTPAEILDRLNEALNEALGKPNVTAALSSAGNVIGGGTADEFRELLTTDHARYGAIMEAAGIKAE